ncbi:hypothetical protein Droror1_Dr00015223, partial [Drosera rotundifolia]
MQVQGSITKWIYHPWDAPNSVLRSAGVELGVNYPKLIVEIDVVRELLSQTILSMQEMAGAEMAETSDGTNEVVIENIKVDERSKGIEETMELENANRCYEIGE